MSDTRLRSAERAAKASDGLAERATYLAQLARAGTACDNCGEPATCLWYEEPNCLPCVEAGMAHGHHHVHDEPDDCVTDVELFDGTLKVVACPSPRVVSCDADWDEVEARERNTPGWELERRLSGGGE